jgi:hypothetical protein
MEPDKNRVIKGEDIRKSLWISETAARNGAQKYLGIGSKTIQMVIPERSRDGLVIRLRGLGTKPEVSLRDSFVPRENGNLLVKLAVYPDRIERAYGSFDSLNTDDMVLEGWVYRKFDEVIDKMGRSSFLAKPMQAETVADLFNQWGWKGVFDVLVIHLGLRRLRITARTSNSIVQPGECQSEITYINNVADSVHYVITINDQFIDSPFVAAAIMAHELCHVVYDERIDSLVKRNPVYLGSGQPSLWRSKAGEDLLEFERMIDLLVCMFKLGEFQIRTSRDRRLTLGYFTQEIFERMQVIVARKQRKFESQAG